MAYTVKKLAEISGVSVRTLHYYDEIGLLPAYVGKNGYRFYQEDELLRLQQLMFFRELGFDLKGIKVILNQTNFDRAEALMTHHAALMCKQKRLAELIDIINKTVMKESGVNPASRVRGLKPTRTGLGPVFCRRVYICGNGHGAQDALGCAAFMGLAS